MRLPTIPRDRRRRTSLALNAASFALIVTAFTAPIPTAVSHSLALTALALITADMVAIHRVARRWIVAVQAITSTVVYAVAAFYLHDQGFTWLSRLALLGAAVSVVLGVLLTHPHGHLILGRPADKQR
ncbi:hypothetical protein JNW90_00870 [Micromonospora sp. STR1s_5]|nr:hypothetical protein [Micromonospora sp. STR1s_5]